MKLRIGSIVETGKPFLVDDSELNETRALVVANSGGGKSFLFRKLNEVLHKRIQCGIIDWKGEYHTLREKFEYVLLGGDKSEVRLQYHAARLRPRMPDEEHERELKLEEESKARTIEMARLLLKLRESFVVDLSAIVHKQDRLAFVGTFASAIGPDAPKALWRAIMMWVDEIHLMCPEKDDPPSKQPIIDLMSLTRQRGAGGMAATQRLSKYEKDGEAEANNYFVGRTALDGDLQRSCRLLGFSTKMWPVLKKLKPGQFFAFGPALNVDEPTLVQIDPVETTHPRAGRIRARVRLRKPSVHLRKSLKHLTELPVIVPGKVVSITETTEALRAESNVLKRKITQLEGELKMAKGKVRKQIVEIEVPVLTPKDRRILEKAMKVAEKLSKDSHKTMGEVKILLQFSGAMTDRAEAVHLAISRLVSEIKSRTEEGDGERAEPPTDVVPKKTGGYIAKPENEKRPALPAGATEPAPVDLKNRILHRLAFFHPVSLTRDQVAYVCDISRTTKSFISAMSELSAENKIDQKGRVSLVGDKFPTGDWSECETPEARVAAIYAFAPKAEQNTPLERRAIEAVVAAGGSRRREDLAADLNISRTTKSFISAVSGVASARFLKTGGGKITLGSFIASGSNDG